MILASITAALGQVGDPRFRRVLALGIGLALLLLVAVYVVVVLLVQWVTPDSFTLPWIGEITFVDELLSGASVLLMLGLSVFLMVPVASMFTSIFLDDVADAVEEQHYPTLSPGRRLGFGESLSEGARFLGVLVAANLAALVVYLVVVPLAPVVFYALNGFLLGREYFFLVALRRMGRSEARAAWRRNLGTIWATGALMAVPLTVPLLNLTVPILGAATFTHLFHRLRARQSV